MSVFQDSNNSFWAQGNEALRRKEYEKALEYYRKAKAITPELACFIDHNVQLAENRLSHVDGRQSLRPSTHTQAASSIDIVVPVFNALDDVKACLHSLENHTDGFAVCVIVVNDGSDVITTQWLRNYCKGKPLFNLIEHSENKGYTRAVNTGLRVSKAQFVITQNSDTIVSGGWLKRMLACMNSDSRVGIVGPLSNAASWQSVPALRDAEGKFAVNELPAGLTVAGMAELVARSSQRQYPRLSFINGFCFMIRRAVLDAIGYMDEETFPVGYGEENDFCIRAADAGFVLAIADDAYVYHAKSKSFGHERRTELSLRAGDLLRNKHGKDRFGALLDEVAVAAKQLDALRERLASLPVASDVINRPHWNCKWLVRESIVDMHGTPIELMPPPVFGSKGYEVESRLHGSCLVLPFEAPVSKKGKENSPVPRIAIHMHLHYRELLPEFIFFLRNVPYAYSLFVSVASEADVVPVASQLALELNQLNIDVRCFPNRGRDIGPFLAGFGANVLKYEFVCHIHSKRSPHNRNKADWRRQLLTNLMGSEAVVDSIITTLRENEQLGLVFPEYHHSLRGQISWGTNFEISQTLAKRLGMDIRQEELVLFPAGSMFWARVDAIKPLLMLKLNWDDFPEEAGQIDGTLAHAVERLLGEIVVANGFDLTQAKSEKQHSLLFYHPRRWPYKPKLSESALTQLASEYRRERALALTRAGLNRKVAVYTALTGGYDQPVVHEQLASDLDYLLFTDSLADDRGFWDVRSISYCHEQTVRKARQVKANPHRHLAEYDIAVWIDANVVIRGDIRRYVQLVIDDPETPLFGIPHPHRDCIYDEAEAVVAAKKDSRDRVDAQMERYKREGYPRHNGLIETNLFVINLRHPLSPMLLDEWWRQMEQGSHRDQLSLNYALWKVGAAWKPIFQEKISLRDSLDFAYLGHGRNSGYPDLKIGGARRVEVEIGSMR